VAPNRRPSEIAPNVLRVDVARFGDDRPINYHRQGIQCFQVRKIDATRRASEVPRLERT
jgi:hypothetical protein